MFAAGLQEYSLNDYFGVYGRPLRQPVENYGHARVIGQSTVISLRGEATEFVLHAVSSGSPHLDFIFFVSGGCSYFGVDDWVTVNAQLIVVPNGLTKKFRFEGDWDVLIIRLPREATVSMTPNPPKVVTAFDRASVLERAMYNFACTLLEEKDEVSAVELYAFEQLLLEMGGASILDRVGGGWAQGAPHSVMLDRAKAIIAQQCADPTLSPATVAFEVQSSLRQLQSIFSEAGTTIAAEIRSRRAYEAYSLLRDARYDVLTTDQVAERSGFGTTMSMRRALVEIYGLSPKQARRQRD
ncbi:AraC family transcriptional regulator [Glutamicibacter sp.]|uniref:AraC family transcriptional regulator n=1 Tax=Glutamicibacter sp. TaxID=1931995 RepID=UPI0028BF3B3A|nr:AraC family transcriptional regulator [Glutamicibacter sp.]